MKKIFKKFTLTILLLCLVIQANTLSMFASSNFEIESKKIVSANYNDTKVMFNGEYLSISKPLLSVTEKGNEGYQVNYMPLRGILEQLGYNAVWNELEGKVFIDSNNEIIALRMKIC